MALSANTSDLNTLLTKIQNIPVKDKTDDRTINGATVSFPAGFYNEAHSGTVANGSVTINTPTVDSNGLITTTATLNSAGWISSAPQSATHQITLNEAKTVTGTGSLNASSTQTTAGSASMTATGFTPATSSSVYITLSTTAGAAKGSAGVASAGYISNQTASQSGTTSIAVNGNGTKLYIPTYDGTVS